MKYLSLKEEKNLWRKGFKRVACLDEAGRGCLAGPVVAAAVVIKNPKSEIRNPKQILNSKSKYLKHVSNFVLRISNLKLKDSKKLTSKVRERFYKILTTHPGIEWGIGRVSEKVIDKINILEATKLAMLKAIKDLEKKLKTLSFISCYRRKSAKLKKGTQKPSCYQGDRRNQTKIDFLIIDGNFKIDLPPDQKFGSGSLPIPQKSIIKADEKVFSCAAASILAKVWRDRIMKRYHKKYPQYRFDKHKGYPTKLHLKMLKKYGPCKIHRRSFEPVFKSLKKCKTTT